VNHRDTKKATPCAKTRHIVKTSPPVFLHSSPPLNLTLYKLQCFSVGLTTQKCPFPWGICIPCNTRSFSRSQTPTKTVVHWTSKPQLTNCGWEKMFLKSSIAWAEAYLPTKWHRDPSNHLATWAENGGLYPFGGGAAGSPFNAM